MNKIILASTSPRRKELLKMLRLNFITTSSGYEEDMQLKMPPAELAKFLALGKAQVVARKYKNGVIIAGDTFVVLGKKLLGKPKNKKDAERMLKAISGRRLKVVSGYAIVDAKSKKKTTGCGYAEVYIKKLTEKEISWYISTKEPLDKAAAFAIQGYGAVLIRKIVGDYFTVIGLPIFQLAQSLRKFGITIIK